MSLLDTPSTPTASAPGTAVQLVTTLLIPLVTIISMVVLLALHDIDAPTAVGVIGLLSGVHGGAVVANASASK